MASDNLISVIGSLIRRENRLAREEKAKLKASDLEAVEAEEEDEDEDPVGEPEAEEEPEEEPEPEAEPEEEEEPVDEEEPNPEGDTKPTGPDPALVAQVAQIVKQEIKDEEEEKKEDEIKLSGKKEKINTKPKLEQIRKGKMNFREAVRMSVTGTHLAEGYESAVLEILEDEGIDGPLGYEPFFEKGKLYVEKGSEKKAAKALKQSREVSKVPKIVGEELSEEEYLQMEAVAVDGRLKGFREALRRLTYEKIKALKKEGIEVEVPEGMSSEGAAEFMAAASAAKKEGKKKFKFGGKEYPVTIKVDIPLAKEEVEINEIVELYGEAYKELNPYEQVQFNSLLKELSDEELAEGLADYFTSAGRARKHIAKMQKKLDKIDDKEKLDAKKAELKKKLDDYKEKNPSMLKKMGRGLMKFFGSTPPTEDEVKKDKDQAPDEEEDRPDTETKPEPETPDDEDEGPETDDDGNIKNASDAQKIVDGGGRAKGWTKDPETGKVSPTQNNSLKKKFKSVVKESQELQAIMALDDAGIKAEINRKGQVVIKKKDKKKAHIALEKSFKKGGWPPLKLEDNQFMFLDRKPRKAYELVSEARNKSIKNKPEWENEDSRLS